MKAYGALLNKSLYLLLGNGNEYRVRFCREKQLLYGFKQLFSHYSISEGSYIFFDYITPSELSVSFYSNLGVHYLNGRKNILSMRNSLNCNFSDDMSSSNSDEESLGNNFLDNIHRQCLRINCKY